MILGFHLINGQDIVADASNNSVMGTQNTVWKLKKPIAIIPGPPQNPGGPPSLGMADYLPLADKKEIEINADKILFTFEPMVDIKNAYSRVFGNGLLIPSAQSILGVGGAKD
ncbi:MAG: hypothetical protein EBU08_19410 [Micrococcales bacterium]|nr:hypothetical protein [Micrococcales bacterium]